MRQPELIQSIAVFECMFCSHNYLSSFSPSNVSAAEDATSAEIVLDSTVTVIIVPL